jgi:hypothetical protein
MTALLPRLAAIGILLAAFDAPAQRLYFNSFQSGKLTAVDIGKHKALYSISVEDGTGIIGLEVTPDGGTLLVVDGGSASRVRVFAAGSGKLIASRPFRDRSARLGGRPVVSLSADGKWLFIRTRGPLGKMGAILAFDVERRQLFPPGKQLAACDWPEFAGSPATTLVAVCPGAIIELLPFPPGAADFVEAHRIPIPEVDIAGMAMAPDGKSLYIFPYREPGLARRVLEWRKGESGMASHEIPGMGPVAEAVERRGSLCISADGAMLGIVAGPRAVILNRQTMMPRHSVELPGMAQEADFTPDGKSLITLDASASRVWEVSTSSGEIVQGILAAPRFGAGPKVLKVSAAPRAR